MFALASGVFGPKGGRTALHFSTRSLRLQAPAAIEPNGLATAAQTPPQTPVLQKKKPPASANIGFDAIKTIAPTTLPTRAETATETLASERTALAPEPPTQPATQPASAVAGVRAIPADSAQTPAPAAGGRTQALGSLLVPGSVRLRYTVTGQNASQPLAGATAELLWLQDGAEYEARQTVSTLFATLRARTSVGQIGSAGLAPARFGDKAGKASEVAAHFERAQGVVRFSANTPDAPLLEGAQDQLSMVLQLTALLAGDAADRTAGQPARYAQASVIALQTIGPRDADEWLFAVEGEETLNLPMGDLQARKLTRYPRRPYDQKVELWLAPSLNYLPARIKITDSKGNFIDQQLRSHGAP